MFAIIFWLTVSPFNEFARNNCSPDLYKETNSVLFPYSPPFAGSLQFKSSLGKVVSGWTLFPSPSNLVLVWLRLLSVT